MKLGQGITTVVGPNGCGKTNIVDAIRWVLGEQKYSILRSGKMEDVIFNGSEGTKPLGVCEVSMTVHNNSGKLPIEYNDVEIARRVYRNGESEYYLNKTQCRLKDIINLFVDTGMGADAYSVIELKMIEQILSENADDRRKMFEEAAGIHKYRTQKKSTLRRFEATRIDLDRVQDIIAEVEQKVHHLELQLKRFKRHARLIDLLKMKDTELAFLQIHELESSILPLRAKINEWNLLKEDKSSKSEIYKDDLRKSQETYKAQELEIKKLNDTIMQINDGRDSIRNEILISSEKSRGALLTIDRLNRESKNNYLKIEQLKQLSLDFDKELDELEPTINDEINTYNSKKEAFIKIEKKYQDSVKHLDSVQNKRWELQRAQSDKNSLYARTKEMIVTKTDEIKTLDDDIKFLSEQSVILKSEHASLLEEKKIQKNNLNKELALHTDTEIQFKLLKNQKDILKEKRVNSSASISSMKGQLSFYSELIELKEGFPEGTRYVLENPEEFPGILGTIADVFQTNSKYHNALETGLGDLSHCLIAKDKSSALRALAKAQKEHAGDLTIIPLKEVQKLKPKVKTAPKLPFIEAKVSDVVLTSNQLKPLAEYLLGDVLIVNNLMDSANIGELSEWNLVDIDGAYLGNDLVLKNRQYSEHGHTIGRQEKLNNFRSQLDLAMEEEKNILNEMSAIDIELQDKRMVLDKTMKKLEANREKISQVDIKIARKQMSVNQNREKLVTLRNDFNLFQKELKHSETALKVLQPEIDKCTLELEDHETLTENANNAVLINREERDRFQSTMQDIRIKLIELESRREQLNYKRKSGKDTSVELKSRQQKIKDEITQLEAEDIQLKKDTKVLEKELKTVNAQIQKDRSILELKQTVYTETYQRIEELQALISNEQSNREKLLEDLKQAEFETKEKEQKIKIIKERILERYDASVPNDLVVDQSKEQLEIEISKMQRSIENIGPINMAVQDEHSEAMERLEILSSQKNDLLQAEKNLIETINKIDRVARKRFQETFSLIKNNFEKLFNLFFEGGNATLRLSGDPDPLEADLSIDAQPPGKRNTSLRLLSSGEKALTAISLLFAIYQVKPSPYCILDEVDAPLDDVNIHKFTRVLGKFCDETQFIIVTHNKLTMEIADYMYGVTQEKKGISKLVSVKFD